MGEEFSILISVREILIVSLDMFLIFYNFDIIMKIEFFAGFGSQLFKTFMLCFRTLSVEFNFKE